MANFLTEGRTIMHSAGSIKYRNVVGDVDDFFQHLTGVFDAVRLLFVVRSECGCQENTHEKNRGFQFHQSSPDEPSFYDANQAKICSPKAMLVTDRARKACRL